MGSWIRCKCGYRIHTNLFAGEDVFQLIRDSDYDGIEDPVDREKLSHLFFTKGVAVYLCKGCGRLLVEWNAGEEPTSYLPEARNSPRDPNRK